MCVYHESVELHHEIVSDAHPPSLMFDLVLLLASESHEDGLVVVVCSIETIHIFLSATLSSFV